MQKRCKTSNLRNNPNFLQKLKTDSVMLSVFFILLIRCKIFYFFGRAPKWLFASCVATTISGRAVRSQTFCLWVASCLAMTNGKKVFHCHPSRGSTTITFMNIKQILSYLNIFSIPGIIGKSIFATASSSVLFLAMAFSMA